MRIILFLLLSCLACDGQSLRTGVLLSQGRFQPIHFSQGVYYGNSLVLGTCASVQANRWTTLLSGRFSVTETTFGVGGQTMMQAPSNHFTVSDFISKPTTNALIFLEWGVNDAARFFINGEGSLSAFIADYTTAINFLVASRGWSLNDIIVITGIDYEPVTGITRAQYFTFADALVALCQSMGIKYVYNFPHYTKCDTVHPDDAGYVTFTNYVETTMRNTYLIVSP